MNTIHTRIRQRREELGLSMKELAQKVGVSAWQTVQQWEREGGTAPKRSRLQAVADALQTSPEFLTYGPGQHLDFSLSMKGLLTELENAAKNSQAPARGALSDEAVKVGAAFDRIESKAHKDLVIAALRAFGGWIDEEAIIKKN